MESSPSLLFKDLALPESLQKALEKMKFETPTDIQAKTLPIALEGKDIIGCAQTGTGKTGAFVIPTLARLAEHPEKTALIMTPTRELAMQIFEVVRNMVWFEKNCGIAILIGGASYGPQFNQLRRNPRIIIGTPGRIQDHLNNGSLRLNHTGILVLDEADRMLDMGFAPQIESILKSVPADRQTFLFTATLPREIEKIAERFMKSPTRIMVGANSKPVEKIKQEVIETHEDKKFSVLVDQINQREGSVLIFAKTKRRTDLLAEELHGNGFKVALIHGDRTQGQRADAIRNFRSGQVRILVATDVAARGLDVPHIAHVINFDLPQVAEDFIHRIGRTARAGAEGNALSFVTPSERGMWKRIHRLITGNNNSGYSSGPSSFQSRPGGDRPQQFAGRRGDQTADQRRYGPRPGGFNRRFEREAPSHQERPAEVAPPRFNQNRDSFASAVTEANPRRFRAGQGTVRAERNGFQDGEVSKPFQKGKKPAAKFSSLPHED